MPKQWENRSHNSAYMYLQNGIYCRVDKGISGEWYAGLFMKSPDGSHQIMDWEFESNQAPDIERAKDLAHAALKLWLAELAEGV
jgi:hypothetical protein